MKTLRTLLRLRENTMRQRQVDFALTREKTLRVAREISDVEAHIQEEQAYAVEYPETAPDLSAWLEKIRHTLLQLKSRLQSAQKLEKTAREHLDEAWREKKKAEKSLELKIERERIEEMKRQDKEMDEIVENLIHRKRKKRREQQLL